jgi:hypothetical protein
MAYSRCFCVVGFMGLPNCYLSVYNSTDISLKPHERDV